MFYSIKLNRREISSSTTHILGSIRPGPAPNVKEVELIAHIQDNTMRVTPKGKSGPLLPAVDDL